MNDELQRRSEAVTRELGRINAMYTQWAVDNGSDYAVVKVLMALQVNGAQTQRRISEEHVMPKQSVNNVVRSLQRDGYVELRVDPTDRRQKMIHLTPTGLAYAEETLRPSFDLDARITTILGTERHEQLLDALVWYGRAFKSALAHEAGAGESTDG